MGFFAVLLLILFVIVCLLLIFLVIVQDEDSDSIGGIFSGGSSSAFGSRASNIVTKITYVLGALFFITAFTMAIINKSSTGNIEALATQQTQENGSAEWWKGEAAPEGSTLEQQAPAESTTQTSN
ncbi:MAG: preprotein translocase subunit SecG [Spirochaetia bacterium]|jgi:preprotein translocase subunit SecG|nr:preprotein translocase subunit SecG [Spirochaetia bacterium]